jgi:uncharacterized protein (TIRG00374 family)
MTVKIRPALKLAVSVTLLAIILFGLGAARDVGSVLAAAVPAYVALALAVFALDRFLMTYKWLLLLGSRGLQLPLVRGVKIYCAAMVWGLFLPATVGADAIRGYMATREGLDGYEVFASITIERLVGFVASLLFGLAGFLILSAAGSVNDRLDAVWWLGGVATLLGAAALVASFNQRLFGMGLALVPGRLRESRIVRLLTHFHGVYRGYGRNRGALAAFFVLTIVEQCFVVLATWITALALSIDASLLMMAGAVPLAMLVSRLPVSIDGLGVYEGVMVLTLSLAGVSPAEGVALALAYRGLQIVLWLPFWLAYMLETGSVRPPKPAATR